MKVNEIVEILEENDLNNIEELKNEDGVILLKFFLDFDSDVLSAAKSYANEESDYEDESVEWYNEYLLPYLYDYANDEVLDIVEEIVEELEIAGEVMAFQLSSTNYDSIQFMALFTAEDNDITIEEVAKEFILG